MSSNSGINVNVNHTKDDPLQVTPADPSPSVVARMEKYDTLTDSWTLVHPMSEARSGHAQHTVGTLIYALGGTDGSKVSKTVEVYDPNSDTWTSLSEMSTPRCFFQSVVVGTKIYVIGGMTANGLGEISITPNVEVYETQTDTWTQLNDMPEGVMMGLGWTSGNLIHVLCGYKDVLNDLSDRVFTFNISSGQWSSGTPFEDEKLQKYQRLLPFVRNNGTTVTVYNGILYKPREIDIGGQTREPEVKIILANSFSFNPSTGDISDTSDSFGSMPLARYGGGSVDIGNDHYAVAGVNENSNTLRTVEKINFSSDPGSYQELSKLSRGRSGFGSSHLGNEIFISGGVISRWGSDFLQIACRGYPSTIGLNGLQHGAIALNVFDENGESPDSVLVRVASFTNLPDGPVIFRQDDITCVNGYGIVSLLPRSTDLSSGPISVRYDVDFGASVIDENFLGDAEPPDPLTGSGEFSVSGGTPNSAGDFNRPSDSEGYTGEDYTSNKDADSAVTGSYLKLKLIAGFFDLIASNSEGGTGTNIAWQNDKPWVPRVYDILASNSGDFEETKSAINRLKNDIPFGGSPIISSVFRVGSVLDLDSKDHARNIIMLTDGYESGSDRTITQAIDELSLRGDDRVPGITSAITRIVPDVLSVPKSSYGGSPSVESIVGETDGTVRYVLSENDSDLLSDITSSKGFLGTGSVIFEVDLGDEFKIEWIEASYFLPDSLSEATASFSLGRSNRVFSPFSDKIASGEKFTPIDAISRYIRVRVDLLAAMGDVDSGLGKIIPPELTELNVYMHRHRESFVLMNSIVPKDSPAQVFLSLSAERPVSSSIEAGVSTLKSNDWSAFDRGNKPAGEIGHRTIFPLRHELEGSFRIFLEELHYVDGYIYRSSYGPWAEGSEVSIYKDGTDPIDPAEYKLFPRLGTVVFNKFNRSKYAMSVKEPKKIVPAALITNRVVGEEAKIAGSGLMYTDWSSKTTTTGQSKTKPSASNLIITPLSPTAISTFTANYSYSDLQGRPEDGSQIRWYVNGQLNSDLNDRKVWSNVFWSAASPGDSIYFTLRPRTRTSEGILYRSPSVTVSG